jgi:hypothetical protein
MDHEEELLRIRIGDNSNINKRIAAEAEYMKEHASEQAIGKMFEDFDTNHDGDVDQGEFIAGMQKIKEPDDDEDLFEKEALSSVFIKFDLDGSGKIDIQEFKQIFAGDGAASAIFIHREKAIEAKELKEAAMKFEEAELAEALVNPGAVTDTVTKQKLAKMMKETKLAQKKAQQDEELRRGKAAADGAAKTALIEAEEQAAALQKQNADFEEMCRKSRKSKEPAVMTKRGLKQEAHELEKKTVAARAKRETQERQKNRWKAKQDHQVATKAMLKKVNGFNEEFAWGSKGESAVSTSLQSDTSTSLPPVVGNRRRRERGGGPKNSKKELRPLSAVSNSSVGSTGSTGSTSSTSWSPIPARQVMHKNIVTSMQNGGRPRSAKMNRWRLEAGKQAKTKEHAKPAQQLPQPLARPGSGRIGRGMLQPAQRSQGHGTTRPLPGGGGCGKNGGLVHGRSRSPLSTSESEVSGIWILPDPVPLPWGMDRRVAPASP